MRESLRRKRRRFWLVTAGILFLVAELATASGCHTQHRTATEPVQTASDVSRQVFAGNEACRECHRAEFELHQKSRHAMTMRAATLEGLGPLAPAEGPIAASIYSLRKVNGALYFDRTVRPLTGAKLEYALGSGKDAITFIGEFGPSRLTEFRMTYLPRRHEWCVTPGQEATGNHELGDVDELGVARRCVLCHAVKAQDNSPAPDPRFVGVGCESCHGPAAEHVAARRAGRRERLPMDRMGDWGASRLNAVCARCHRSIDDIDLVGSNATGTARFAGFGLELSRCFRASGDRLSCVTCHDPHADTRTDSSKYEKACLSCHSRAAVGAKACPINPRSGCIPCHMPRRPIFPDRHVGISMADHLIMAYRKSR